MSLIDRQAELYRDLWSNIEDYAKVSPGEDRVAMFQAMTGATSGTVLDAGCGAGKGAVALAAAGFTVTLCDLTDAGLTVEALGVGPFFRTSLWHDLRPLVYLAHVARETPPQPFEYVYCCDVLEHVPTEYTMLAISRLLEVSRRGLFLSIALVPDQFGVWAGEPLHQTVQPFTWWRDRLADLGELVESRDCLMSGVYLVRPRA